MTMHLESFTAHNATLQTPTEELVPSRYALRLGNIDVMVISDGVLPLPTQTMSTNADPAERAAWFKEMYLGPDAFDWALNVLVVRSGEQVILVDAGLGGQFPVSLAPGSFPNASRRPVSTSRTSPILSSRTCTWTTSAAYSSRR